MSCDRAQRLMVLMDALSKEEQVELQRHLQDCKACHAEWLKWQRLFDLLNQLPTISSTPQERAELMNALMRVSLVPELTCSDAKNQIWRWIDGDLSGQEVSSLIVHLANCDRCQSILWQAERTIEFLRSMPRLEATSAEKEALKAKLKRLSKRPTIVPFVWRVVVPFAAAASIFAFFALSLLRTHSVDNQARVAKSVSTQLSVSVESKPSVPKPKFPQIAQKPQEPQPVKPAVAVPLKPEPKVLQKPTPSIQKPTKQIRIAKAEKLIASQKVSPEIKVSEPTKESRKPEPEPKAPEPTTIVTEAAKPNAQQLPLVLVPSETPIATTKVEPTIFASETQTEHVPVLAQPKPEPRQLVALPPITIDAELPIEPPRIKLTVVPPSQRLYQQSGVAFVTVPPEKRPIKPPEEKALTPDLSIPLAAERYRSHTATIPLFRFGISW